MLKIILCMMKDVYDASSYKEGLHPPHCRPGDRRGFGRPPMKSLSCRNPVGYRTMRRRDIGGHWPESTTAWAAGAARAASEGGCHEPGDSAGRHLCARLHGRGAPASHGTGGAVPELHLPF